MDTAEPNTWQISYTDAQGVLITELLEAETVMHVGQHVVFRKDSKVTFLIDQRALHSARNVNELDMGINFPDTTGTTQEKGEDHA